MYISTMLVYWIWSFVQTSQRVDMVLLRGDELDGFVRVRAAQLVDQALYKAVVRGGSLRQVVDAFGGPVISDLGLEGVSPDTGVLTCTQYWCATRHLFASS